MANFYCEYCGKRASSVSSLTFGLCRRHPNGTNKGNHKLYEGSEKSSYTCKYCGISRSSVSSLTFGLCRRHPNGTNKGKHAPALDNALSGYKQDNYSSSNNSMHTAERAREVKRPEMQISKNVEQAERPEIQVSKKTILYIVLIICALALVGKFTGGGKRSEVDMSPANKTEKSSQKNTNSIEPDDKVKKINTYYNEKYNYVLYYPSYLYPQGESDSGDGQKFLSKDNKMSVVVWSTLMQEGKSISDLLGERRLEENQVSYSTSKGNVYYISGYTRDGKIYYEKGAINPDSEIIATVRLEYDDSYKSKVDDYIKTYIRIFPNMKNKIK